MVEVFNGYVYIIQKYIGMLFELDLGDVSVGWFLVGASVLSILISQLLSWAMTSGNYSISQSRREAFSSKNNSKGGK